MFSCRKDIINEDEENIDSNYTFFVAGHTYGKPGVNNKGLHPPFEAKFDLINERNSVLGFLTGDIVKYGTEKDWDEVDSVLKFLNAKVYFAPGNHDVYERTLYESRYGPTYYNFYYNDDLFIVLDPNLDHWNISGEQLEFLKNVIEANKNIDNDNIFVFFHQLLWWAPDNKYSDIKPNSFEGRADTTNFWSEIEPLFHSLPQNVYMFAGDIGAGSWSADLMYDCYDNITFVASGMGEGNGDNFVIVNVNKEVVNFELIALDGDNIHAMGDLEDYDLP
jgi:hypothetical protein